MSPPPGFAAAHRRALQDPAAPSVLSSLLALIGYEAEARVIEAWSSEKRAEAEVYAVNVHLRASDNVLRRCPRPAWLPEPWLGEDRGEGAFGGPTGTSVMVAE